MVQLDNESTAPAVTQALSDSEKQVRAVALDRLTDTNLPTDQMTTLLSEVIDTRTTEEQQAALLTLGTLPPDHAEPVLEKFDSTPGRREASGRHSARIGRRG